MGKLDTQDAGQLIRTLSVVFLNLVPADAESLSITYNLCLFSAQLGNFRFELENVIYLISCNRKKLKR